MSTKNIYLFRHGETDWNLENRFQGSTPNIPLNRNGEEQAKNVALKLKGKGIEHIYSSPLDRAAQTALIVAKSLSIDITNHHGLVERNCGEVEGMTLDELLNKDPEIKHLLSSKNCDFITSNYDHGVETVENTRNRISLAMHDIMAETNNSTIAISSHAAVLFNLLSYVIGHEDFDLIKNGEIIHLTYCNKNKKFSFIQRSI